MYCESCHYGSDYYTPPNNRCTRCGCKCQTNRPFPDSPQGMGSGNPNGKTARKRLNNMLSVSGERGEPK